MCELVGGCRQRLVELVGGRAAALREVRIAAALAAQDGQGVLEQRAHAGPGSTFRAGEDEVCAPLLDGAEQRRATFLRDGLRDRAREGGPRGIFCATGVPSAWSRLPS